MPTPAERHRDLYRELLDLPEDQVGEIIAGELHVQPRPAPKHAWASSGLGADLFGPYSRGKGGPGGWWILDEPELHLGEEVLVPDIGGWKKEQMPTLPETAWFELPPDWICEILSQSTARKDRILKMPAYARHGVEHAWLLDPVLKTLEVYRQQSGLWTLIGAFSKNDRVSAAPFEDVEIELALLWGE